VRYERRGDGSRTGTAHADLVVGADGRFSFVGDSVGAPVYNVVPPLYFPFYAYLRDVEAIDPPLLEIVESREAQGVIMLAPCDDGIWMAIIYTEQDHFASFRRDHARLFWERLRAEPLLRDRLARARRITPVRGRGDLENFMRVAAGPGWALVGDAGQHKDPIYGQGIGDAVRTAWLLAHYVERATAGDLTWEAALAEFAAYRDFDLLPSFDWMIKGSPQGWSRDELGAFLDCLGRDPDLSRRFVNLFSHGVSAPAFFDEEARRFAQRPAVAARRSA
jgi:2-polyprenyl-6-methoxyphenol hydroxylase-like FAD-dependent oxidoreductase